MEPEPSVPSQDTASPGTPEAVRASLRRPVLLTRLGLAAERGLQAFWPALSLGLAGFAVLRLGLLGGFADPVRFALFGLLCLATLALVWRGARQFAWPSEAEAVARIDDALPGRPVAALSDQLASGGQDAATRSVWAAHMARIARRAAAATVQPPDLRLSRRDPRALRYVALTLAIAALFFGSGTLREQLRPGVTPDPAAAGPTGPVLEAWASPPAYTGTPTLYLTEVTATGPIALPTGSTITLRVYGEGRVATLSETLSASGGTAMTGDPAGVQQAEFVATRSGGLSVSDAGTRLGGWEFTILPDTPPAIALVGTPERTTAGAGVFAYSASDDFGVSAAWATVTLDPSRADRRHGLTAEPEARPEVEFDLPLPPTGASKAFEEKEVIDLSLHPWAGLPVLLTLHARDAAGQVTRSEPYPILLPGRRFYDPLARAVVEGRRDLLWTAANAPRVVRSMQAASWKPDSVFKAASPYLVLRSAIRRLDDAVTAAEVPARREEVADLLWQAALMIEDGDLSSALERLRRAQDRLSKALESDASDREIAELMDQMREAMSEYLQELAREAMKNPDRNQAQDQAEAQPDMSMEDLQSMLDKLQEMMKNGQKAEAQQLLQQLQQMMENLQMTLREGPPQPGQGQGQQMMQGLQDLMQRQQGLGDQTFDELQRQFGEGQEGTPQEGPGTGELGRQQEALRQLLEQFREGMPPGEPGQGTEGSEGDDPAAAARRALEEAERKMGEARDSLEQGDPGSAVDQQAEALENLRDGMRALNEAQRQAQATPGQPGGTEARDQPGEMRDPLGRPLGNRGQIEGNDVKLPGSEAWKRARDLQDEIRRRSGDQSRPRIELDYLRRLLDRF